MSSFPVNIRLKTDANTKMINDMGFHRCWLKLIKAYQHCKHLDFFNIFFHWMSRITLTSREMFMHRIQNHGLILSKKLFTLWWNETKKGTKTWGDKAGNKVIYTKYSEYWTYFLAVTIAVLIWTRILKNPSLINWNFCLVWTRILLPM